MIVVARSVFVTFLGARLPGELSIAVFLSHDLRCTGSTLDHVIDGRESALVDSLLEPLSFFGRVKRCLSRGLVFYGAEDQHLIGGDKCHGSGRRIGIVRIVSIESLVPWVIKVLDPVLVIRIE